MLRALASFAIAREGVAASVVALSATALLGAAALGVDVGAVYLRSRALQGVADLAALSAAQDLSNARARAQATADANLGAGAARVSTELGRYDPDPKLAPSRRFAPGAARPNAVRVRIDGAAPLYFGAMFVREGRMQVAREAVASQAQEASFQIGSRLLALRGGAANALLGGLTGSSVSLSVMDYESLLRADVDLFRYFDALRVRLHAEAASYDRLLRANVETSEALDALADLLAADGDRTSAAAMRRLAEAAHARRSARLDRVFDLGVYGAQDGLTEGGARIGVSALDLAMAILEIANGDRQVAMDLGALAPGVGNVRAWLAIGERPADSPWLAVTADRAVVVRTAQMRLYVEADIAVAGLSSVASARLPLFVEMASAQARLSAIECGARAANHRVTLSVAPSLGTIAVAEIDRGRLDNFRSNLALSPARLVSTALVRVDASARVDLGGERWQDVRFSGAEIQRRELKRVETRDLARASVSSLLGGLSLDVRVLGIGLGAPAVTNALRPALANAAAPLDGLLGGVTGLLGVHLGEADVRVNGVRCGGAALVG